MFEKEAEEYEDNAEYIEIDDYGHKVYGWYEIEQAYQKGAEFAYNKANEWHYVKDGLPKELHDVICFVIHNEHRYFLQGYIRDGRWVLSPLGTYLNNEDAIAWKEIVLPEPSKYWDLSTGENNINKENE